MKWREYHIYEYKFVKHNGKLLFIHTRGYKPCKEEIMCSELQQRTDGANDHLNDWITEFNKLSEKAESKKYIFSTSREIFKWKFVKN